MFDAIEDEVAEDDVAEDDVAEDDAESISITECDWLGGVPAVASLEGMDTCVGDQGLGSMISESSA